MSDRYVFPTEEDLFQRRVIELRSVNYVPRWWLAAYVSAIIAGSIVGAVAIAWDDIVKRVNTQEEQV